MTLVAKLGKTVGLKGFLRLHVLSDFPEQFQPGRTYHTRVGVLTIEAVNARSEVKFEGYDTKEDAAKLTNLTLSSTPEESKELCELDEDEFFWDDIIGLEVYEGEEPIGRIEEIERFPTEDHLLIIPCDAIKERYGVTRFLFPYSGRTIEKVDLEQKRLYAKGALETIAVLAE